MKFVALILLSLAVHADNAGTIVDRLIASTHFSATSIGTPSARPIRAYLPPDYAKSNTRYPVVYYFANADEGHHALFDKQHAREAFDSAIQSGAIRPFILISVDTNTPVGASWCVDSPVTGAWDQFLSQELVAYVDREFRTIPSRAARGLAGDRMGGYCAMRLAMRHADIFASAYALHPVGTGSGVQLMYARPNWDLLHRARSLQEVNADFLSNLFLAIFQAHLPNAAKAPLFAELPAGNIAGQLVFDAKLTDRLHNSFFLERMIPQYADNLKTLRGLKLDWGRNDSNHDHVYANQALTRKMNEFGIPHEAEEYNGSWGDRHWGPQGRIAKALLPFFADHLLFSIDQN
jgi:hypothetical protein